MITYDGYDFIFHKWSRFEGNCKTLTAHAFSARQTRRRPRLAVAVVEGLVTAIVTEHYAAGTALPPENVLCDMYEVSRTVVREATTALTEKGLVVSQQGRGTIVQDSSHWSLLDPMVLGALFQREDGLAYLDNLIEIRTTLEASMAGKAAQKITPETAAELSAQLQKLDDTVGNAVAYVPEDVRFHEIIMRISGDRLSAAIIHRIQDKALKNVSYFGTMNADHIRVIHAAHHQIHDAIINHDAEAASAAMREHIESSWRRRRPVVVPS